MRDIDRIIDELKTRYPDMQIEQHRVLHAADDDRVWFIRSPDVAGEVQIESPNGQCPFMIESSFENKALTSRTVQDAVTKIEALIEFGRRQAGHA